MKSEEEEWEEAEEWLLLSLTTHFKPFNDPVVIHFNRVAPGGP